MTACSRYQPMLAGTAPAPFSDDNWLFEIKWDGVRAIAAVGSTLSLRSRNDTELSAQFPELAELVSLAPGTVLDGEIVVMSGGKPDMQALLPRVQERAPGPGAAPVTYLVFDILGRGGEDLTRLPLSERRRILNTAVREGPHVVISEPVQGPGEDYYRAAVARGLEGVMAKRKDSPVRAGGPERGLAEDQSAEELRLRHCRVYRRDRAGAARRSGPSCWGCTRGDSWSRSARSGPGFPTGCSQNLWRQFAPLVTTVPQFPGIRGKVVWLEPVLVCEVEYMEVTRDRKLRMPRFHPPPEPTNLQQPARLTSSREQHGRLAGNRTKAGKDNPPEAKPALRDVS